MSFISADVLAVTRSARGPVPHISIRAVNTSLPASRQTTTGSAAAPLFASKRNPAAAFSNTFHGSRFFSLASEEICAACVEERRVAEHPCMVKANVLIQVEEGKFGAGRVRSHSHMPRLDQ